MFNDTGPESVESIKAEIEEYHRKAQIQNKELLEGLAAKKAYQRASHWAVLIWCVLMLISAIWLAGRADLFSGIEIMDAVIHAFETSVASYLYVNSISLFIASFSKEVKDYSKWKIKRTGLVLLFIAVVLTVGIVRWWLGLGG